jgi:CheY-like chemotaxis protein
MSGSECDEIDPVDDPAAASDVGPATLNDGPAVGNGVTILLVEYEGPVRAIARRILVRHGYAVIEACDGLDALRAAAEHAGEIDMVVTDMVMPELSGRAFVEQFVELYPGKPVLFVSGYPDDEILRRGPLPPRTAFLEKPFTPERLIVAVESVLSRRDARG